MTNTHLLQIRNDLAVVIPYFKGAQYLHTCMESLLSGSLVPALIVIVDNDPLGLTPDLLPEHAGVHLLILRTRQKIGFGRAVNSGIAKARETGMRLFLVLNQDTRVHPQCVERMIESLLHTTALSIIMPMHFEYANDTPSAHFTRFVLDQCASYPHDLNSGHPQRNYHLDRLIGACILLNIEICDHVGMFDPLFYMYGEDNDLALRLLRLGGTPLLDTAAFLHHRHSMASADGNERRQINAWQWIARIMLRIRYTGLGRMGFIARMLMYALRALAGLNRYRVPWYMFLQHTPRILWSWNALKTTDTGAINQRAFQQIREDAT